MSLGINVTTVAIRPELEEVAVVSKPLPYIDIIRGDALKKHPEFSNLTFLYLKMKDQSIPQGDRNYIKVRVAVLEASRGKGAFAQRTLDSIEGKNEHQGTFPIA